MSLKLNRIANNVSFGQAWSHVMDAMRVIDEKKVLVIKRKGWNGDNQYVRPLVSGAPHPTDAPDAFPQNPYFKLWDNNAQADGTFNTFAIIKTTQNQVFPWTPSQGDLFAWDWEVHELEVDNG